MDDSVFVSAFLFNKDQQNNKHVNIKPSSLSN